MSLFDTGIRPSIDQYLLDEAAKVREYGKYWSASSAGYCYRKLIFERLKVPHSTPDDPRKQRVFSAGKVFHDWIQQLTKDAGLSIAQEVELQDEDLMIRGHFDDLVLVKNPNVVITDNASRAVNLKKDPKYYHLILYDYKTVNSKSFTWAKKNGGAMSYYHRYQLATYMYMLRKGHQHNAGFSHITELCPLIDSLIEARILKISKDDLRMEEQQLMWSEELEKEVKEYWEGLNEAWQVYNLAEGLPACTCADHENGFLAKETYNPYFYNGIPCSLEWYEKWKADHADK